MEKWGKWMVVGGLAADVIDAFTTQKGGGGMLYGTGGVLSSFNTALPGGLKPGEMVAVVGVVLTMVK